jgi:hypothetical protein
VLVDPLHVLRHGLKALLPAPGARDGRERRPGPAADLARGLISSIRGKQTSQPGMAISGGFGAASGSCRPRAGEAQPAGASPRGAAPEGDVVVSSSSERGMSDRAR